ncbi:hypothetical protein F5Y17DRAFT_463699 [Xylariaceae sp. FL0594]|nr:hypothetical protein F5Y17DRAFT_463699 [Xylariaceae sp. FL0594]
MKAVRTYWWKLNVKDKLSLERSFTKLARQILRQHPEARDSTGLDLQHSNLDEVIEAVKAWLGLPGNTRWLLVYDNFDHPELLSDSTEGAEQILDSIFPEVEQGSIIVTTRLSKIDKDHRIRLRKLDSIGDSLQILAKTSDGLNATTDATAKRLAQELDGLPLALATAGAYLRGTSVDFSDYLRLYKESWVRLQESTPPLGSYQDKTLCSTWQLSYAHIQEKDPPAAHLLQLWAYFDHQDVSYEFLRYLGIRHSDVPGRNPAWALELADELNFHSAMRTLQNYGFVEPHTWALDNRMSGLSESRGYSMHACVHSWTVSVLNAPLDVCLARLAAECLGMDILCLVKDPSMSIFGAHSDRILPHVTIAAKRATEISEDACIDPVALEMLRDFFAERMMLKYLRSWDSVTLGSASTKKAKK